MGSGAMRRAIFGCAIVVAAAAARTVQAQAPVSVTSFQQRLLVDYPDALLQQYGVQRFEYALDGGAWVPFGVATSEVLPSTIPNGRSYAIVLPPVSVGDHALVVRTCNAIGCGAASGVFAFRVAIVPPPPDVATIRVVEF